MSGADSNDEREVVGWRCSSCGQIITSIEDGWVEWLAWEDDQGKTILRGLRLIHRQVAGDAGGEHGCRYDPHEEFQNNVSIVEGLALERFVGPDGLMLLLSFVEAEEFPKEDVLELAKRVHVPRYELTRELFPEAISCNFCSPFLGAGYYLQSEMEEVLAWGRRQKKVARACPRGDDMNQRARRNAE
jgi:hypothetical protein